MILLDANILLYAEDQLSPLNARTRAWWDGQLSGGAPVCLCWSVINAFIRISTNPRVFTHPLSLGQAAEHGCELMSTDADFSRFRSVKWRNPLA